MNGGEWGITLTDAKHVKVGQHKEQTYVSFCEETVSNGKTYKSFINLNENEWNTFLFYLTDLEYMFSKLVQYKQENGDWYFLADQAKSHGDEQIKRRLVPSMKNKDVFMMLYAHLIADKIRTFSKKTALDVHTTHRTNIHICPLELAAYRNGRTQ